MTFVSVPGRAVILGVVLGIAALAAGPASANHTPPSLRLDPQTATNTVGEQHCVTATYRAHGQEVGVPIVFSVTGANPTPTQVTVLTQQGGKATFCYVGTKVGTDMIIAFGDVNSNGRADPGEPTAMASKTWLAGPPTSVSLTPPTATNLSGLSTVSRRRFETRSGIR